MALTAPRPITQKHGVNFVGPVKMKASTTIYHGALVVLDDTTGLAEPATAAASKTACGVADLEAWVGNPDLNVQGTPLTFGKASGSVIVSAASGTYQLICRRGVFKFLNKGADALAQTDILKTAYIEDDQTVRKTATGTSAAGTLVGFDPSDGLPLVQIGGFGEV